MDWRVYGYVGRFCKVKWEETVVIPTYAVGRGAQF